MTVGTLWHAFAPSNANTPICSDLITSAALLDYIADLDLNYVVIETSPC
jgi:hypothetical protein